MNRNVLKDYYSDKKVTVIGGTGYIGSELVAKLKKIGATVKVPSIHMADAYPGDIISPETDVLFHLGAETNLAVTEKNPGTLLSHELAPWIDLVRRAAAFNTRIVFAGSVTQRENVVTFYDATKRLVEFIIYAYAQQTGQDFVSLHLSNVYGPSSVQSGDNRGYINRTVQKIVADEVVTFNRRAFHLARDFIYIDDVIEAFVLAGMRNVGLKGQVLCCSGFSATFNDLFLYLSILLKRKIRGRVVDLPLAPIDARHFTGYSIALRATGWYPLTLLIGLKRLIKHYKKIQDA